MADYTIKRLEEFDAIFKGGFRRVRAGLGVTSFGLAVMQFPPNFADYPVHDQSHDSQEEVYTVTEGRVTLILDDGPHELEPGVWVRVGPGETRKLETGEEPATVIAIGAIPGGVYEPPEFTEEGAPDPLGVRPTGQTYS